MPSLEYDIPSVHQPNSSTAMSRAGKSCPMRLLRTVMNAESAFAPRLPAARKWTHMPGQYGSSSPELDEPNSPFDLPLETVVALVRKPNCGPVRFSHCSTGGR